MSTYSERQRQKETSLGSTYTERLTIKNIIAGTDGLIENSESLNDNSFFNSAFSILDGKNESVDEYQNLYVTADVSIGECKTLLRKLNKYNEYYLKYYGAKRIKRIESDLESAKEKYLSVYREAKQKYEKYRTATQTTAVQISTTIPTNGGNVQQDLNGSNVLWAIILVETIFCVVLIIKMIKGKHTPVMQADTAITAEKPVSIKITNTKRKAIIHDFYEYAMNYPKGEYKTAEEYQAAEPQLKADKKTALKFGVITSIPVIILNLINVFFAHGNGIYTFFVGWLLIIGFWRFAKYFFEPFQYKTMLLGYFIGAAVNITYILAAGVIIFNIAPHITYFTGISAIYILWCGIVCLLVRNNYKKYIENVQQDLMRIYKQCHPDFSCPGLPIAELINYRSKKAALYVMEDTEFENDFEWLKARRNTIKEIKKGLLQPEINFTSVKQADIGETNPKYAILVEE